MGFARSFGDVVIPVAARVAAAASNGKYPEQQGYDPSASTLPVTAASIPHSAGTRLQRHLRNPDTSCQGVCIATIKTMRFLYLFMGVMWL